MKEHEYFETLVNKWLSQQLTENELQELLTKLSEEKYRDLFSNIFTLRLQENSFSQVLSDDRVREAYEKVSGKLGHDKSLSKIAENRIAPVHRIHFLRTAWFRVAVAIIIIFGIGTYLWQTNRSNPASTAEALAKPVQNDVMPGGNKAILMLADGSVIPLDSAVHGTIAQQSGAHIQKSANGEIIYAFDQATVSASVAYNTMSTPRGGQYQLILPDGSRAWLNAESSITFPTVFTGNKREIKMTGEVFFDVKQNKEKPFIVKTVFDDIQVLGTSFNVNTYPDETPKIALVEGAIKIRGQVLAPGQAFMEGKIADTNIEQDIAWKNGVFAFKNEEIKTVMRQIARWYDLEVKYEGQVSKGNITGKMSRSWPLSRMMTTLKRLGFNTTLKGKTIVVSQ